MPPAPLPPDEDKRLAALRALRLLDTAPDPRFDVFTRLAARACGAPIALITLVDTDRQWFKSSLGMPPGLRQTPREQAFCGYTILQGHEPLCVIDATSDPRFQDNHLVTSDFHLRAYCGVPIHAPGGQPIGSLCVLDRQPHAFSPSEIASLRDLAEGVSAALELHGALQDLTDIATHDPLTGAGNRALLESRLAESVRRCTAERGVALLAIDLDRFKEINDFFGHAGGDAALLEVARRLRQVLRAGDSLVRLGGDEFIVLLDRIASPSDAQAIASRILANVREPFALSGQPVALTLSIGIAVAPQDADTPDTLMAAADAALYVAKREGRDRAHAFQPAPATAEPCGRRVLQNDLRRAAETGEGLSVHFQPLVAAEDGTTQGFEALLRWHRPGHGAVSPTEFIAMAEANGLVAALDRWALGRACAAAARWPSPLLLSVNISPVHLQFADLAAEVAEALAASRLDPARLMIEITETASLGGSAQAGTTLEAVRRLGVRLALDDFGAGHASLAQLARFRFDVVKIDGGLIAGIGQNPRAAALVRAALQMGQALQLTTVAEGVETEEQAEFLRRNGCTLLQGYLLGRPGPIGEQLHRFGDAGPVHQTAAPHRPAPAREDRAEA